MALRELPVRSDLPKWSQGYVLDGVRVVLEFWWHEHYCAWVVDVYAGDGETPLSLGQRVSPLGGVGSVIPNKADPLAPPGNLFFDGSDPYQRTDLGNTIRLYYDEVTA